MALTLDTELLDMLERDPGPLLARVPEALEPVVRDACARRPARWAATSATPATG